MDLPRVKFWYISLYRSEVYISRIRVYLGSNWLATAHSRYPRLTCINYVAYFSHIIHKILKILCCNLHLATTWSDKHAIMGCAYTPNLCDADWRWLIIRSISFSHFVLIFVLSDISTENNNNNQNNSIASCYERCIIIDRSLSAADRQIP